MIFQVPDIADLLTTPYNCSLPRPYIVNASTTYSARNSVLYYVNVGRNVAKEAALTHFIFPLDIELYPSPYLGTRFLNMIARDPPELAETNPRVFALAVFEVQKDQQVCNAIAIFFFESIIALVSDYHSLKTILETA